MIDVGSLAYKPGWKFRLGGPGNRLLCIYAATPNSLHPDQGRLTQHQFELPGGELSDADWARWVLYCLLIVEQHEACEFFTVGDVRPFYPHHQDEGSPYELVDRTEELLCR